MKRQPISITAGLSLACLLASLAVPMQSHAGNGEGHTQIDVQNDGITVVFTAYSSHDLLSLTVRVGGPDGIVFSERVEGPTIEWVPDTKLADGTYSWEARAVTAQPGAPRQQLPSQARTEAKWGSEDRIAKAETSEAGQASVPVERHYASKHKNVLRTGGAFQSTGGYLEMVEDPGGAPGEHAASTEQPAMIERLVGNLLSWIIPAAKADQFIDDDLTLRDVDPCLRYHDTDDGDAIVYHTCGQDGPGYRILEGGPPDPLCSWIKEPLCNRYI